MLACGTALPAGRAGGVRGDPVSVALAGVADGDGAGEPAPHPVSKAAMISAATSGGRRDSLITVTPPRHVLVLSAAEDYCTSRRNRRASGHEAATRNQEPGTRNVSTSWLAGTSRPADRGSVDWALIRAVVGGRGDDIVIY